MLAVTHPAGYPVHDHSNSALCHVVSSVVSFAAITKALSQSLYVIYDRQWMKHNLKESAVSPSSGPVLLSDVAAAAGVSLATASRALNGQAGVGAALAEKVRQVARDPRLRSQCPRTAAGRRDHLGDRADRA